MRGPTADAAALRTARQQSRRPGGDPRPAALTRELPNKPAEVNAADAFRERFLADLLNQGMASFYERRARVFEWAAPRPGDFVGRATPHQLAAQAARCRETATAFRNKAAVLRRYGPPDFVVGEVAGALAEGVRGANR
jgi:hypothetical protein